MQAQSDDIYPFWHISGLAWDPTNTVLVVGAVEILGENAEDQGDIVLQIVRASDGQVVRELARGTPGTLFICDAIWDPSGASVWAVMHTGGLIHQYRVNDGALLQIIPANESMIKTLAMDATGHFLASSGWKVRLFNTATGQEIAIADARDADWAGFSPDGTKIATVSCDGFARIWEVPSLKLIAEIDTGDEIAATAGAWSPDNTELAVGTRGTSEIQFWNVNTGHLRYSIQTDRAVNGMLWNSATNQVISRYGFGIQIWNPDTGQLLEEITTIQEVTAMAITRSGNVIARGLTERDLQMSVSIIGNRLPPLISPDQAP